MKPLSARDPFRIGIVAIILAGLLGLAVVGVSVIPFGKKSYTAILAQTAGLRVSEDVKVHGVPVGEITGIKLDGDQVKVTFTVSKGVRLGGETSAAVTPIGVKRSAQSPSVTFIARAARSSNMQNVTSPANAPEASSARTVVAATAHASPRG